ncbi:MAG: hypothetical protein AAFO94_07790, partial [Bacteroidota bacterium]
MTKQQLTTLVFRMAQRNSLRLPEDFNMIPGFRQSFADGFGNVEMQIENLSVDQDEQIFSGDSNYWGVPVTIHLQFFHLSGKVQFSLEVEFEDDWSIEDSWPKFKPNSSAPKPADSKLLYLSSDKIPDMELLDNFDRAPQLYFVATQTVSGALQPVKWLLGEAPSLLMAGPITIEHEIPDMELIAHIANTVKLGFFNNLPVAFVWNSEVDGDSKTNEVYYQLQAFIPFEGDDLIIKTHFDKAESELVFTAELDNVSLTQLTQLDTLTNGTDLLAALPAGLDLGSHIGFRQMLVRVATSSKSISSIALTLGSTSDWDVMPNFTVNNLELNIEITDPTRKTQRKTFVDISGDLVFTPNTTLTLKADYPEKTISAQLAEGKTIPISELSAKVFPIAGMPELSISTLEMDLTPDEQKLDVRAQLDSAWNLSFGGTSIQLHHIKLDLSKDAQTHSTQLEALTTLFDLGFTLSGKYASNDGWTFEGVSTPGDALSLSRLVRSILDTFKLNIPLYFPELQLSEISLALNTNNKRFALEGTAEGKSKIPLGGIELEATTSVLLKSELDAQNKRTLVGALLAEVELMNDFVFQLQFSMADQHPVIFGQWAMVDDKKISLDDLLEALGIGKIPSLDPISDNLIKTLRREVLDRMALTAVSFNFDAGSKELSLKASTDLFGDLSFVAHKQASTGRWQQIVGLEFPSEFKLSDIPGLNEELKATDFMQFENVALLLSTSELNGARLPAMPDLAKADTDDDSEAADSKSFLEGLSLFLSRGVNVAATINLKDADDASLGNLAVATDLEKLVIQSAVGGNELNFRSSLGGGVGFSGGESELAFQDPYVQLDVLPKFGLQLGGTVCLIFLDTMV